MSENIGNNGIKIKWYRKKWVRILAGVLAVVLIISAVMYSVLRAKLDSLYADISESGDVLKEASQQNAEKVELADRYEYLMKYGDLLKYIGAEMNQEAIDELNALIPVEEDAIVKENLRELLSELYYNEGMYEEATKTADECIKTHKEPPSVIYYVRGMGNLQTGNYSAATEDLKMALSLGYEYVDTTNLQIAISTYSDGKYEEAAEYSVKYLNSKKERKLFEAEDVEATKKAIISNDNLCRYMAAISYMHMADYIKSINYLDEILVSQEDSELYYYRGIDNMALEDYEEAVEDFSKAKELGKKDTELYYDLGICLVSTGRIDEGIEALMVVINNNDRPELTTASANILTAIAQEN